MGWAAIRARRHLVAKPLALGRWHGRDLLADLPMKIALARAVNVRIPVKKTGAGA